MKDSYPYLIRYLNPIRCVECGKILISDRSRNRNPPRGQRCDCRVKGKPLPQWKPKNAIDAVKYSLTGSKSWQKMTLDGDF